MRTAVTVIQTLVRIIGPIMIVLGVLFWTRNALNLIGVHMLLGMVLVLLLWALAALAVRAGVGRPLIALTVVWSLVMPALGIMQSGLLVGDFHWVIQVLHLLVGLAALGLAERLATAIKRAPRAPAGAAPTTSTTAGAR